MGIFTRIRSIFSANVNNVLDKCEDPEVMLADQIRQTRANLADTKLETARVMAEERIAKETFESVKKDMDELHKCAKKALKAGKEEDAEKLLRVEAEREINLNQAKRMYETAQANSKKMNELYEKMQSELTLLEQKSETIKQTMAVAKATERISKFKMPDGADGAKSVNEWEKKANKRLYAAQAAAELDLKQTETEDLKGQYSDRTDVSDRMAALKKEIEQGDAAEKEDGGAESVSPESVSA